jgi:1-acyl-sn-glycerol-3-phosphate acyltransferase
MEPVFRTLEIAVNLATRAIGTKITYQGLEYIPDRGGAVIAINHTSYVDWWPAALAAYQRHRRMRFMIKTEMQDVKVVNFLIKHSRTIPVDRTSGGGAYAVAVERLRAGEIVGVYPEATISRSFELMGCTPAMDQGSPTRYGAAQQDSNHRRGGTTPRCGRDHR